MNKKVISVVRSIFSVEEEEGGFSSNVGYAFTSQAISLALSFVMSLVVPKVLGVEEYAHWQLFLFYAGYVGITMLGVGDGIYLRLGGKRFSEIDDCSLKIEAMLVCLFQVCVAVAILIASFALNLDDSLRFVLYSLLIYGLVQNTYGIIAPVFQAVNLTRVYSISIMINRIVFFVLMLLVIVLGSSKYEPLVISYIFGSVLSLVYCLICARRILAAKCKQPSSVLKLLLDDVRNGFKVMVAYYASTLVVGVARQVVVMRWGLETFGQMSFAFSMVSFALVFIAQLSLVFFPVLRRLDLEHLNSFYAKIRNVLFVVSPLAYLLYLPVIIVLSIWLPQYAESFRYLGILMPLLVFDGKMNMLCSTYFKVYNDNRQLLLFNVIALVISLLLSCVGAYIFDNIDFVVCGLLTAIMARSVISERFLAIKRLHLGYLKMSLFECLMAVSFVLSIFVGGIAPLFIPLLSYAITLFFNKGVFRSAYDVIRARTKK